MRWLSRKFWVVGKIGVVGMVGMETVTPVNGELGVNRLGTS